jgi:hypothetical protein
VLYCSTVVGVTTAVSPVVVERDGEGAVVAVSDSKAPIGFEFGASWSQRRGWGWNLCCGWNGSWNWSWD